MAPSCTHVPELVATERKNKIGRPSHVGGRCLQATATPRRASCGFWGTSYCARRLAMKIVSNGNHGTLGEPTRHLTSLVREVTHSPSGANWV
jgi:hypothetical protein